MNDDAVSVSEVVAKLKQVEGLWVLDQQPFNVLVEGNSDAVDRTSLSFQGWSAFPRKKIPVPSTRPRVLNPPSE
jgi:hypothetical protein